MNEIERTWETKNTQKEHSHRRISVGLPHSNEFVAQYKLNVATLDFLILLFLSNFFHLLYTYDIIKIIKAKVKEKPASTCLSPLK